MKKSELMKIIREEVEVVLTNEEAIEMFDLDLAALLESEMSYQVGKSPDIQRKSSSISRWESAEKEEAQNTINQILEDGIFSSEEQTELRLIDSIESLVSEVFEAVNIEDANVSDKFMKASEAYRSQLRNIIRAEGDEGDLEERKLTEPEKEKLKSSEEETPKQPFIDQYGKEKGEEVYYATLTKRAKEKA